MTQLETLIQTLCPNGVKFVKLGDCCQILDSQRRPITKSQREAGEYPYYGANGIQDYVADYIFDGVFLLVGEDGSVLTPNGNPVVTWAEGKIWVNNHAHILAGTEIARLRFLFYVLQTLNISHLVHGNIPKLTKKDLQELQIPLPPLAVQSEIVRVLDKFTLHKAELAAELAARLQQYEYYRDQLLTFDDTVKRVKLGEVGKICMCKRILKSETNTVKGIPFYKIGTFGRTPDAYISEELFEEYKNKYNYPLKGQILISASGTIGRTVIFDGEPAYFQDSNIIWIDNREELVLNKFLYYYYQLQPWNVSTGGTIARLYSYNIENAVIPIPSLEVQERIVSILDRFDKLCHDIREGLPAEIELRQKQYEHYRDKLLTFEAKG